MSELSATEVLGVTSASRGRLITTGGLAILARAVAVVRIGRAFDPFASRMVRPCNVNAAIARFSEVLTATSALGACGAAGSYVLLTP